MKEILQETQQTQNLSPLAVNSIASWMVQNYRHLIKPSLKDRQLEVVKPIFACKKQMLGFTGKGRGAGGHKLLGAVFFTPVLSL